jgi:hypothetical protein
MPAGSSIQRLKASKRAMEADMTAGDPSISLNEYSADLVRYAADEATRDAEEVIALLTAAGLAPPPGETRDFPPGLLLDLGAAVRLKRWEAGGHEVHTQSGLPSAGAALVHLLHALESVSTAGDARAVSGRLAREVFDLAVTRFAWAARPDLGADIELAPGDDDAMVEALAQFLWAHRHHPTATP